MENYTIYDEIGRGTHSFVYKARRKRSIEYVAVKSTAKTRMEKILNEVQILHRLDSRYVLKFYNWYESQNHIWLIFEYCIGGDLLNLITQDRLLPAPAVRTFGWELVAGLRYLHTNGILYCDLKPANILIDECGSLKLADFGLARRIPTAESMAGRQLAPGSPNYMAPELFQPAAIHSYASDFWALGCVLYELCTGRPPFTHTFFPELARIIQNEPLMIPVEGYEISTSFADLLERLLEKDPYQRITWDELLAHPFWSGCEPLDEAPLPPQELFEASRPEAEELPTESLSISIQDHEGPSMPAESMLSRGRESSATETASDGSNTSHQDESSVEKPLRDDDESLSESESDSQDEIVHEVVGTRPVRPVTAPALLDVGSRRLSHRKNKEDISTEQSVPRMKTAPSSGTNLKRGLLVRQMSPSRKAPLIKASRLLFVAADATVKPIAFCGDIETVPTPPVHSDDLEFEPLSSDNLLSCTTEDLEYHLKSVYINLKSTELTAADKNNVLAHLFSLSLTPKLANVILNSSLLTLLVRMLRQSHLPLTPGGVIDTSASSMIMLVLGVLFRLGTFISTPSPEHVHNLVSSLSYFLTNNPPAINPMTRRRAAACLGELLFYLAAQQNGGLVPAGASTIVRAMEDADSIVKHYAIRTVTNILARGADDSVHVGLVHEQTVLALARCLASLNAADDESLLLKTSTVQAIAQLFRQLRLSTDRARSLTRTKLSLLTALSKNSLLASLWRGAASGHASPELATASLNVLNCYLELSARKDIDEAPNDVIMKHKQVLLEKLVDMAELSRLLEVRSKYEDDDQLEQNDVIDADLSPNNADATTNESRRRYNTEDRAAPTLLRAKAILFVHFGILHSMVFARQCVRTQVVDKIETSLSPFSSILRSHLASPAKVKSDAPVVASPRQLPPLDHYVLQCGQNVVCVCIRSALKMSAECISSTNTIAYEDDDSATGQPFTSVIASEPFQLFEQLIKNATCCSQLCYFFLVNEGKEFRYFIRLMSKLLTSFASETLAAMGSTVGTVISRLLLRLFQSSSTDAAALVATEPVELFTYLLPAVVVQLLHPRETGDDRLEDDEDDDHSVNCIQLVYLIMLHLDYDLNQTAMVERDRFVEDHLMPCFRVLLGTTRQNEKVWRFALELLHGLVTRDALMTATLPPQGLVGPILALLSAPVRLEYHSLPSNATALVHEVVEMHKKSHSLGSLYAHDIARHVNAGLERMVHWGTFNSGTVHLLEVLYILLFHRYDERRKTSDATPPPPGFDDLVECGPSLLQICAHADDDVADEEPQDSPRTVNHAAVVHLEVLDAGSRCLIFLSQIFGARLNAVFFGSSTSKASKDEVARCLITCLQSHHDRVLHHVLLTIKNALRCDKNSDTAYARRWLQSDKAAMAEIVRVSKRRVSPSTNRDVKATAAQVVKTASEIVTHLQNA